jgi:phosphatidylglycerol:prolipoprotein diacylglycerol transferase
MGYAALRFGLEFLRADERGGVAGLSTSQWLSIALVGLGAAMSVRGGAREGQNVRY